MIYRSIFCAITICFTLYADRLDSTLSAIRFSDGEDAQEPAPVRTPSENVAAAASPDSVTVGDPITLNVGVRVPSGARVIPPETDKGFGDFIPLSWDNKLRAGKDVDTVIFHYRVAAFKPENCTIPPLPFLYSDDGSDDMDTLWSPPIPIRVTSVIPPDTPDSAITIRDLKKQQRAGRMGFRSLWLLAVVAAAIIIYYILERRFKKRGGSATATIPLKPPYEEALELLAALEKKRLLERCEVREYVFELSEIFKRYIGRRYDTIAPELTTEEIVNWLEFSELSRDMRICAEWFFRESDHVKYAKQIPDTQTLGRFMKEVRTFVEATKPQPTPTVGAASCRPQSNSEVIHDL